MQLVFIFDEFTDVADVASVRGMADDIINGMRNSGVPQPTVLGEISRQFWTRTMLQSTTVIQRRFMETFQVYVDSVVEQAQDRANNNIRNVPEYFQIRRKTIGAEPCFILLQMDLQLLPTVLEHPTIVQLETHAIDMISIANDIYSYNVEQARGDDLHNIVTVVRNQFSMPLDHALLWLKEHHDRLVNSFLKARDEILSLGEEYNADVSRYIDGLATWVRANDLWSFETQRYFGLYGSTIQKHRKVVLLPRM